MLKLLSIALVFTLTLLITSCAGNDFHYDTKSKAIVSNHGHFTGISIEVESLKHDYICQCDLGRRESESIPIMLLASLASRQDSDCSKSIYKANTIITIRNSGGDAGPYSIKLLIDSNKNIKEAN